MDDTESEIFKWAKDYAQKNGLFLNPDYDLVVQAIKGLAQNKREYGIQYCGYSQDSRYTEKRIMQMRAFC